VRGRSKGIAMHVRELLYILFTNRRFIIGFSIIVFELFIALIGPLIYPVNPFDTSNPPSQPPSDLYPLGTDRYGRDIFAQLMVAVRNSLYIGGLTGLFSILIGLAIGLLAGLKGGIIDEALMSITNVVMILPSTLLAIIIITYIGYENASFEIVALVLSITAWTWFTRALRAQLLSLREREFIYLSKMAGYSQIRIGVEDMLPHLSTYIIISFVNYMNLGINAEVGLSILGLTPLSFITLGKMLYFANITQAFIFGQWWTFVPPGVFLIALSTSLLLIASGIDEVFNPRLRRA